MSDNLRPSPDVLDAATAALRDAAVPPGPPDRLIADTLAAVATRRAARPSTQRRRWIMRIIGVGTLTTAAAVVTALVAFPAHSPAGELKKAVQKAEQAKTVRVQIETDHGGDNKMTTTNYIAGDKLRTEFQPRGLVVVVNGSEDPKGVMLITKMQTFRVLDPDKDALVKQVREDVRTALAQFKVPADDKVKGLPDENLDGRKTKVYEIKNVVLPGTRARADLKMWIDPKTDLPVQSRVSAMMEGRPVTTTAKYLGFNEELDPKLFETKVPEGYRKR
jgi:outer membrane lipoprotein-sorting protein